MNKTFFFLNLLSFIFTIVSFSLAITYEVKMYSLYKETASDDTLQFEYLYEVLCHPSTILQIVVIVFDVCYYSVYFVCESSLLKGNEEEMKMRPAQVQQDNRFNNLLMDFTFFLLIKGIALSFSCFYSYESVIELTRLLTNSYKAKQIELLNSMLNLNVTIKWFLISLMIYIAWVYIIRFIQLIVTKRSKSIKIQDRYNKIS